MKYLFICYPKCSTCQKAQKWLKEHRIEVEIRDIVKNNPTNKELINWISESGIPIQKFFNTSGLQYKALGLKNKLNTASEKELIDYLASDGKLVKRPLLIISENKILIGFKEEEWAKTFLEK